MKERAGESLENVRDREGLQTDDNLEGQKEIHDQPAWVLVREAEDTERRPERRAAVEGGGSGCQGGEREAANAEQLLADGQRNVLA